MQRKFWRKNSQFSIAILKNSHFSNSNWLIYPDLVNSLCNSKLGILQGKVKRIGLFGSYIRGEQKRYSDIDFLVEFKEANFDNFMGLVFGLETMFGKKVELITNGSLSPYIEPYVEKEVRWYEAWGGVFKTYSWGNKFSAEGNREYKFWRIYEKWNLEKGLLKKPRNYWRGSKKIFLPILRKDIRRLSGKKFLD